MKSKASFKSHPLHPILVAFPIAFLTGAFFFELTAKFIAPSLSGTAAILILCGIVMGFVAAVPGIIDYRYTVPPSSSASRRAAKHGLLNTTAILIFIIVYNFRDTWPFTVTAIAEAIALTCMTAAGWMGGTLVHRNQIGVDIRYARAGKWKEVDLGKTAAVAIEVATESELETDQMKLLHINGKRIVLARTKEGYVAFDDRCTHRGASLAAGTMICGTVQCPWHGSQFDVRTGELKCGPATAKIPVYTILESNGKVLLSFR